MAGVALIYGVLFITSTTAPPLSHDSSDSTTTRSNEPQRRA